ncbi:MAG: hypothetical protein KBD63_06570 [Bacteriovoracaceae bacterium]|nr:hypothetical protein [Bacteriovoracaceae bacterium]
MFNNEFFDKWLEEKSSIILNKMNKEALTSEEIILLILKAQSNHFHHMDLEFRAEFQGIHEEFKTVRSEIKSLEKNMDNKFHFWGAIIISLFAGIYLKLFLG